MLNVVRSWKEVDFHPLAGKVSRSLSWNDRLLLPRTECEIERKFWQGLEKEVPVTQLGRKFDQNSVVEEEKHLQPSLIRSAKRVAAVDVNRIGNLEHESEVGSSGEARDRLDRFCIPIRTAKQVAVVDVNSIGNLEHEREVGSSEEALNRLDCSCIPVDCTTYASLLRSCKNTRALSDGKLVHDHIIRAGYERNIFVANLLIQMYGFCGALEDASSSFAKLQSRDRFSWNFVIRAFAKHGQLEQVLQLYEQMKCEGVLPDRFIFVGVLSACADRKGLIEGRRLHCSITIGGSESDVVVGTALVCLYGKCDRLMDAKRTFDLMPERNEVSWNVIIAAFAQNEQEEQALVFYARMQQEGVTPNEVTFTTILDACATAEALAEGKQVHACLLGSAPRSDVALGTALVNMYGKCGVLKDVLRAFHDMPEWNKVTVVCVLSACANQAAFSEGKRIHTWIEGTELESDIVVGTALVNMYGKCGSRDAAWRIFDKMPEKDIASWNAMMAAYAQQEQNKKTMEFFDQMQQNGILPNAVTFVNIISAFASSATLSVAKQIHARVSCGGFETDVTLGNALVHMYGKCGSSEDALKIFLSRPERNVVSWNAMIAAYAQNGQDKGALQLFVQMLHEAMLPDKISVVSFLDSCSSQAALNQGKCLHSCIMNTSLVSDVVIGNTLINMYGKCGRFEEAVRVFDKMPVRDQVTFVSILSACAIEAGLSEAKEMHSCIVSSGFKLDVNVGNSLINMYGKCGSPDDARRVFDEMPEQDVVSWTAMITAYAQHGQGKDMCQLFELMEQEERVMANKATLISFLSACSHTGLVDEGCHSFVSMNQDHEAIPVVDQYNCIIDSLGRAGRLDEAENLISSMPFQPTVVSWMTLLGVCRDMDAATVIFWMRHRSLAHQTVQHNCTQDY